MGLSHPFIVLLCAEARNLSQCIPQDTPGRKPKKQFFYIWSGGFVQFGKSHFLYSYWISSGRDRYVPWRRFLCRSAGLFAGYSETDCRSLYGDYGNEYARHLPMASQTEPTNAKISCRKDKHTEKQNKRPLIVGPAQRACALRPSAVHADCGAGSRKPVCRSIFHVLVQSGDCALDAGSWFWCISPWKEVYRKK